MPTYEAIVDENRKVQLPERLVEKLGIEPGHRVEFFETLDGEVFFHAIVGTTKSWKNLFQVPVRNPPISIREMDEGIADHLAEEDKRILARGGSVCNPRRTRPAPH